MTARARLLILLITLALLVPVSTAQAKDGIWHTYKNHMDQVLEDVIEMDIWGTSTPQLPKGFWKIKYQYNHQKVNKRFGDNGEKVPFAPSLSFPDILGGDQDVFFVDLQGKTGGGKGAGHTFQMSYGITDPLDFYIELPFQYAKVQFDVQYQAGDLPDWKFNLYKTMLMGADLRTIDGFWQFIESMGRPKLKEKYKTDGLDLGDIHFGLSWNYFKGEHFAAATTNRMYIPSGYQPDANNTIELFTGAGFPAGQKVFGLSTTQGFDFRLPKPFKWVVFNAEFTWEYRFKARRHAPKFPERTPYFDLLFGLLAGEDPELAAIFPDLRDMGDFYHITFGHSLDGEIGVTINPFRILPLGIKYGAGWSQEPDIQSNSPEFNSYIKDVEIVGEMEQQVLAFGTGITLIPLYIPMNIIFEYRHMLTGKGALVVEDNYVITAELFLTF